MEYTKTEREVDQLCELNEWAFTHDAHGKECDNDGNKLPSRKSTKFQAWIKGMAIHALENYAETYPGYHMVYPGREVLGKYTVNQLLRETNLVWEVKDNHTWDDVIQMKTKELGW